MRKLSLVLMVLLGGSASAAAQWSVGVTNGTPDGYPGWVVLPELDVDVDEEYWNLDLTVGPSGCDAEGTIELPGCSVDWHYEGGPGLADMDAFDDVGWDDLWDPMGLFNEALDDVEFEYQQEAHVAIEFHTPENTSLEAYLTYEEQFSAQVQAAWESEYGHAFFNCTYCDDEWSASCGVYCEF